MAVPGGNTTITGSGFALGATATGVAFGGIPSTDVNCSSDTSCTVTAPTHAAGTVHVTATVNSVTSESTPPADEYTYH